MFNVSVAGKISVAENNEKALTDDSIIQVLVPRQEYIERHHMNPIPDATSYITRINPDNMFSGKQPYYYYPKIVIIARSNAMDSYNKIHIATAILEHAGWDVSGFGVMTRGQANEMYHDLLDNHNPATLPNSVKNMLDDRWRQKILDADAIYVINTKGYIGESMRNEINYAIECGLDVYYMYPEADNEGE